MAVTEISYRGYHIEAVAFEVPTLSGYMSSVRIAQIGLTVTNRKLFTARSPSANGLFDTEQEAIAAGLSLGEKVVDEGGS